MKVLIIAPPIFPIPAIHGGAIETLVDQFLRYNSKKNDLNITVYSPYFKDLNDVDYNDYKNTNFRFVKKNTLLFRFFKLKKFFLQITKRKVIPSSYSMYVSYDLKRKKELSSYDLVIVENQTESLMEYRKYISSRLVEHLHNDYLNVNTKNAKLIVKSGDEFWGVSEYICNRISEIDKSVKTQVLYNGVDLKKYSTPVTQKEKSVMLDKIGFSADDYIVTYVGRIMPEKGVLELVKAFNKSCIGKKNYKLLIVGGKKNNSDEVNKYYNDIMNEVESNKDNIFLYGKAKFDELLVLYSLSSIQVAPSTWPEAFGLISVEGIMTGHPVIVTNSGGLTEVISDSKFIIDKENIVDNLCDRLNKFHSHEYDVDMNYLKNQVQRFDVDVYCEKFYDLIKSNIEK